MTYLSATWRLGTRSGEDPQPERRWPEHGNKTCKQLAAQEHADRQTAQSDRDTAVRDAAAARREATSAAEALRAAKRQARDAEEGRRRDVDAAWGKVLDAERAQAAAEQRAIDAKAAAIRAQEERARDAERADQLAAVLPS